MIAKIFGDKSSVSFLVQILVVILALSLVSCDDKGGNAGSDSTDDSARVGSETSGTGAGGDSGVTYGTSRQDMQNEGATDNSATKDSDNASGKTGAGR